MLGSAKTMKSMKTKKLLITTTLFLFIFGALAVQRDSGRRPIYDYVYAEGHGGLFFALSPSSLISWTGAGIKITPRHYLGVEAVPRFSYGNSYVEYSAEGGLGLQYQHQWKNLYLSVSGGTLESFHYSTDASFMYRYAEATQRPTYFRIGVKYGFGGIFCMGWQYAQSSPFEGYVSDFPAPAEPRYLYWQGSVRSFTFTLGVMLQNPPNRKRK